MARWLSEEWFEEGWWIPVLYIGGGIVATLFLLIAHWIIGLTLSIG